MTHKKLPAGDELLIGVAASREGATISILQPCADNSAAFIYQSRHPLGDTVGRAFTVASVQLGAEDAARTFSIATDPRFNELLDALAGAGTPDAHKAAYQLLTAHIDRLLRRHQENIATLMSLNTNLAESLASAPTPRLNAVLEMGKTGAGGQVDPSMAMPSTRNPA